MSDSGDDDFHIKPFTEIYIGTKKFHFSSFTWKIDYFTFKTCKMGGKIESPYFRSSNAKWMLSVFPNGERQNDGKVCVSLAKVSAVQIKLTAVSEIIIQREEKDDFFINGRYTFQGNYESFRFPFLLSRSVVLQKDSGYFEDGSLHITCHLFIFEEESPETPYRAITKNPEGEKVSEKKDAGTNTSSKDFGNLFLHKDPPTEKEHDLTLISKDFEAMYENQRFADVILKLGKHEFPVHKLILRSRSKVFEAMFEHDMQENRQDTVDLVDMEADTVKDMLRYIYCGKVRQLSPEEALNLYVAADRYDLQELLLHCRKIILNTLSVDNLCEVSAVADLHNDQLLTDEVKSILCRNMKEILKTDKWVIFAKENPILSLNLIRSAILNE